MVIYKPNKKDILFIIRLTINIVMVSLWLYILLKIYFDGGVILIEPNKIILIIEIIIMFVGIILNIFSLKGYLEE